MVEGRGGGENVADFHITFDHTPLTSPIKGGETHIVNTNDNKRRGKK